MSLKKVLEKFVKSEVVEGKEELLEMIAGLDSRISFNPWHSASGRERITCNEGKIKIFLNLKTEVGLSGLEYIDSLRYMLMFKTTRTKGSYVVIRSKTDRKEICIYDNHYPKGRE